MYAVQERGHQIPDYLKIQKYGEIIYNFLTKLYNGQNNGFNSGFGRLPNQY